MMKKGYIILGLLYCNLCLLFFPMFYYDLDITYITGTQLLRYPLYIISIILIIVFSIFNQYKYSRHILLGSTGIMILHEIYLSLTWYIETIMEFNLIFALGNMKPTFALIIIMNILMMMLILLPEKNVQVDS